MIGPDGHEYQNQITYQEVVAPKRLCYKHGGDEELELVNFSVVVTFEPAGVDGLHTRLTMRSTFPSNRAREFVVQQYNAVEGGKQMLGRLADYVYVVPAAGPDAPAAPNSPHTPFVVSRVFAAPLACIWAAWTQREGLMQWFGPQGVTMVEGTLDLRPGGQFHYGMRTPDGSHMWGQ